ncbi:unnamed protein product [Rotaria magnacalcarata]|uniref:Uncharacterized protein n=2 Tax=Rotaria magnacalcarata TaxID=392030 RepID=A0A819QK51_9BILA|nr:unnamed protein product [Rotaria magnacalcarata]CAF2106589.1 unnamed protein product [Rotaria magnacalcarata]CAF3974711.1 unnamed protein product [Rotaria magnacalcarata]CAF4030012.1 unnamed protein product [Rotaria magnacalcarata]
MASVSESCSSDKVLSFARKDNHFGAYTLIWLDSLINSPKYIDKQKELRLSINYLQTFDNVDKCIKYIQSVSSQHRFIVIVNDDFCQQLIPEVHRLPQVFLIYIYCEYKPYDYQLYKRYSKLKYGYNQFDDIINRIRSDRSRRIEDRHDQPMLISIFNSNNNHEQSTTEIDGQFVQSQLLIAALLKMKTTSTDKNEFICKCRELYKDEKSQLHFVDEFERDYSSDFSLWWYTRETFLYRLLNKALRVQDIDLLFSFGFIIRDLEKQLRQLQYSSPIHVYRAQLISIEELNVLKDSINKLISMNSFLSTTRNLKLALAYFDPSTSDDEFQRVLFDINADPHQDSIKPFADISKISVFQQEEEILIMLGSIFRLINIYCDNNKIWHIKMNLCSDNQCELQTLYSHMANQYDSSSTKLTLFGSVLIDMANFNYAEKYLCQLLKQISSEHKDIYKCYHALGKVSFEKGEYETSLIYLFKSLEILQERRSNDSRLAYIYNSIGEVYQKKNEIKEALQSYEKALYIFKQTFADDHENIAWCYNNLGIIYLEQKKVSEALQYLTKAINIKQGKLPDGHPCLGNTYNNLGNVHYFRHEYKQALEKYQLSYEIFKKSLTPRHPSIARALKNIGVVYEVMRDFTEAKIHYEKALHIRQQVFKPEHPDLIEISKDIERISLNIQ